MHIQVYQLFSSMHDGVFLAQEYSVVKLIWQEGLWEPVQICVFNTCGQMSHFYSTAQQHKNKEKKQTIKSQVAFTPDL